MEVTQGSEENFEFLLNAFPQGEGIKSLVVEFEPVLLVRRQLGLWDEPLVRRPEWFITPPVAAAQLLFARQL